MVTHTTPSRAKADPLYNGTALLPFTNAPPWIHTRTGSPLAPSGDQTFRLRQSVPGTVGSGRTASIGGRYPGFGAVAPNSAASRIPSHPSAGTGAANRSFPNGACAYGTPRNEFTPAFRRPR